MTENLEIRTTDYHTGGEPFRIVTAGVPDIPGGTVPVRREYAQSSEEVDRVRRLLVQEPRGHADMYGCFITPPNDDGAHFGTLFWHKDGYSTACGHGTIALGVWAVETGLVAAAQDGDTDVVIDVPSGRVTARVTRRAGRVERVTFRNVPSSVVARGLPVQTSRGPVSADVIYGGAYYATISAPSVGLTVTPECYADLIAVGREVKWALNDHEAARHPEDPRLSGIYGTILFEELPDTADGPHQRNVTVFADGEVDRSPCGSGTCARAALLSADGRLPDGHVLTHDSIVGSRFVARVAERIPGPSGESVIVDVEGNAYRTGEHVFVLDPHDAIGAGFVLR